MVVSALVAACGSYIIGSYENWGLILVGFFGAVIIFANWIVPLIDMHIINKKHYITLAAHSESLSQEVEAFVKKHHLKMPNLWVDLSTTATQKVGARTQGFFHAKKIVFTQRAIAEYSAKEFLTVLAHEMGHDSLHHRVWYFILIMLAIVPVIGLLPYFAHPVLASAFGFDQPTAYITVLMFGIFGDIIQKHIMTPLINYLKRIFEYQADVYAIQTTQDVEVMSQTLVHTFDNNQGLPFLHPWYSLWYKCHPSLVERITHIKRVVCQP